MFLYSLFTAVAGGFADGWPMMFINIYSTCTSIISLVNIVVPHLFSVPIQTCNNFVVGVHLAIPPIPTSIACEISGLLYILVDSFVTSP